VGLTSVRQVCVCVCRVFIFKDTGVRPHLSVGLISVRQKGGLPGPPPRNPRSVTLTSLYRYCSGCFCAETAKKEKRNGEAHPRRGECRRVARALGRVQAPQPPRFLPLELAVALHHAANLLAQQGGVAKPRIHQGLLLVALRRNHHRPRAGVDSR